MSGISIDIYAIDNGAVEKPFQFVMSGVSMPSSTVMDYNIFSYDSQSLTLTAIEYDKVAWKSAFDNVTPVPEPSTCLILVFGFVALLLKRPCRN